MNDKKENYVNEIMKDYFLQIEKKQKLEQELEIKSWEDYFNFTAKEKPLTIEKANDLILSLRF